MKIEYAILRKLSILKPQENYNDNIMKYFFKTNLTNYFKETDDFDITINIKDNILEISNITTNEEYIVQKKMNTIDFINKKTNEILFHIKNEVNNISCVDNKQIKTVKVNKENEVYSLVINDNNKNRLITLTELKVKISNKDYFEIKIDEQKPSLIGLSLDDDKYEQIFNYLEAKINNEKKGVKKRLRMNCTPKFRQK